MLLRVIQASDLVFEKSVLKYCRRNKLTAVKLAPKVNLVAVLLTKLAGGRKSCCGRVQRKLSPKLSFIRW